MLTFDAFKNIPVITQTSLSQILKAIASIFRILKTSRSAIGPMRLTPREDSQDRAPENLIPLASIASVAYLFKQRKPSKLWSITVPAHSVR